MSTVAVIWTYNALLIQVESERKIRAILNSGYRVRSCRVTIQDMDGVSHTVEVTAATPYEAVAQGLAAIRGNEWQKTILITRM